MKKQICILACLVATASSVMALDFQWENYSADGKWNTAANWNRNDLPGSGDRVMIRDSYTGGSDDPCNLYDNGLCDSVIIVDNTGGTELIVHEDAVLISYNDSADNNISYGAGTTAEVNVAGTWKSIGTGKGFKVGYAHGNGILNVTNNGVVISEYLDVGNTVHSGNTGQVTLSENAKIVLKRDNDNALILFAGGQMTINDNARLVMDGDRASLLATYMASNWLNSSSGTLTAEYNSKLDETHVAVGTDIFDGMHLVAITWDGSPVGFYDLQSSDDLVFSGWSDEIPAISGASVVTTTVTSAETKKFYRIELP